MASLEVVKVLKINFKDGREPAIFKNEKGIELLCNSLGNVFRIYNRYEEDVLGRYYWNDVSSIEINPVIEEIIAIEEE